MKIFALTAASFLFIGSIGLAQYNTYTKKWYSSEYPAGPLVQREFKFVVRGRYDRPVKKEKLVDARVLSDFIDGYPTNWITNYVSVEILATSNGKSTKTVSMNDSLSKEQKTLLKTVDPATEIVINVYYKYKNSDREHLDNHTMHVSMMIVPEVEAEYVGGHKQMIKYFKENGIDKILEPVSAQLQFVTAVVKFTINESGEIMDAKLTRTTGTSQTDRSLIELINKMPTWKPAENSMGIKIKQEFEFRVGSGDC